MEAERNRRENELNTKAKINTAEGEKQRIILEAEGKKKSAITRAEGEKEAIVLNSEGKLNSAKNNAEGEYILQQRIADGKAYEIKQIIDMLGSREAAAHFLLKQREYDALVAIANGPNSKVYFMQNNHQNQPYMPILEQAGTIQIIPPKQ